MADLTTMEATAARPPAGPGGKVITVLSPKGGAGKTTLAVNLAVGLAKFFPQEVVIVDTDLQFGDVATAMGLHPQTTFYDAVKVGLEDPVALKLRLVPHASGVWALCAPEHPAQADAISSEHVSTVVGHLRQTFKYVVVDNEPGLGERALAALDQSTDILMICVTDVPSARGLRKAADALDQVRIVEPRRHFVLNRADAKVDLTEEDIVRTVGRDIEIRIPSSRLFPVAMNRGVPLLMGEESGDVVDDVWKMVYAMSEEAAAAAHAGERKGGGLLRRRGR